MISFNDHENRKATPVPGRTVRKSLSFDGGGQFFFLITYHLESAQILLCYIRYAARTRPNTTVKIVTRSMTEPAGSNLPDSSCARVRR
jgi:hypothetical protein